MRRKLYDESGIAMIAVIMVLLVVSLLSTAVLSMASSNVKNSIVEREYQSAYYIAEAGMTIHNEIIRNGIKVSFDSTDDAVSFFNNIENNYLVESDYSGYLREQYGYHPSAKAQLILKGEIDNSTRQYLIVSRGVTEDTTRTVTKEITVKWQPKIDLSDLKAVFSLNGMSLNAGTINGDIGSNADINISNNPTVNGDYYQKGGNLNKPVDMEWWNKIGTKKELDNYKSYPLPNFPEFPDKTKIPKITYDEINHANPSPVLNLTAPMTYIENLEIDGGYAATIKYSEKNNILVLDNLTIPQGTLHLEGNGVLKIYVINEISIEGGSLINKPAGPSPDDLKVAKESLEIYHKGANLDLENDITIYGSYFGENANIKIDGALKMFGNIITGGSSVEIKGDSNMETHFIYAPNAHVDMDGAGNVKGPIVSNTFDMKGGAEISFDPTTDSIEKNILTITLSDIITVDGATREQ